MEYNTNRFKLIIPEYGRNIHKMIYYAIKIKNRKKRNRCALSIIKLMIYYTSINDIGIKKKLNKSIFQHKLIWNQLFIISKYQLDIDTPFPKPNPNKMDFISSYKKVIYPKSLTNFRYYGKIIRNMIHVAIHCKDEQKKEGLSYAIANTMKKNYLRWNKNVVEDDIIFKDLKKLSNGKICLTEKTDTLLQCSHILNPNKILKKNKGKRVKE
ncbi:DUF4290 domain-containing protein [Blattabacterium cuenoti]|uniref:DUF4290 domain-containing protein n=1 Tax=Blattabacterium cuenoti TaxID=1653831 RepID=UPI00163C663E|nr:DUF4290 domain-containing protein [Blattabacterium cuenoti]